MPTLPSSLALTTIADGTQIVAVDHRNNYTAVQTAVNTLITDLSGGAAGQYLTALSPSSIGWAAAPVVVTYRKTTAKTVNSSVAETDLLNGEITLAAGVLGLSGCARFTAWGDLLNNNATSLNTVRWKLKLGGTTLIDSNVIGGNNWLQSSSRYGWRASAEILNLAAANAQYVTLDLRYGLSAAGTTTALASAGNGIQVLVGGLGLVLAGNTTAIDTTASKLLELTVTLPVSAATMEAKLTGALVEVL